MRAEIENAVTGKRVYISGPVTGVDGYAVQFAKAARLCAELGASWTFNPAVEVTEDERWELAMARCLRELTKTRLDHGETTMFYDTMLLLPRYEFSRGCRLECAVAASLGIKRVELAREDINGGKVCEGRR